MSGLVHINNSVQQASLTRVVIQPIDGSYFGDQYSLQTNNNWNVKKAMP